MSVLVAASSYAKEAVKSWWFKFAHFKNLGPTKDSNDFSLLRKGPTVSSIKSVIISSEIRKNNLELRKSSFTAEEIALFVAESYRVRGH